MQTRFLLGPAGSGKTFRCLAEVRATLTASPEGPPLILLAPKQATFQLERQLLADDALGGYTRLQILSFDRLAQFILEELAPVQPQLLADEGRLMILRALLAAKRNELKLFRATARLPGFAQQVSAVLREFQCQKISVEQLRKLAASATGTPQLGDKLQDLALLMHAYLDWLQTHRLEDGDRLLELAANELRRHAANPAGAAPLRIAGLWMDGFAEMTPQELDLLAALVPHCDRATLAFCLESEPREDLSWLSIWSVVSQTFRRCHQRLRDVPGVKLELQVLPRHAHGRFAGNPVLAHLEEQWTRPQPWQVPAEGKTPAHRETASGQLDFFAASTPAAQAAAPVRLSDHLRVAMCANPEGEAVEAAREILRFVQAGGRFRDVAVLVRHLEQHHAPLRRVFHRYGIPFFLDRREPVTHHLLAELTRSALRVIAFNWRHHDWFSALKTGLVQVEETAVDWLENEALKRGWEGRTWREPFQFDEKEREQETARQLEELRQRLMTPFLQLEEALSREAGVKLLAPSGAQLTTALRQFWNTLAIEAQLEEWSTAELADATPQTASPVHLTVWEQMEAWLKNVELAFEHEAMPLREWLPVLEAGLGSLTVGVIPPALDQVLIGTVDRSRNPDLRLTLLPGMNESVFPAAPGSPQLLTESDRTTLEDQQVFLGLNLRQRLAHERFYGYIACTRGRGRLVLTCARNDDSGKTLNPSPFIAHLQRLFPALPVEDAPASSWSEALHPCELTAPLLAAQRRPVPGLSELASLPVFVQRLQSLQHFQAGHAGEMLRPDLAEKLYGPVLQTSVSRLEKFAECPFRFFVHSGLRAEEREKFEFDSRELGSFQHKALEEFHLRLRAENRRWHDLVPTEARERMAAVVEDLTPRFRAGLMLANDQNRFSARSLGEALKNFIEIIVGWMPQYEFEPEAVEVSFGRADAPLPSWNLDLGAGHSLAFNGQIDRIDLWRSADHKTGLVVVMDYKSSARALDGVLMANGVQLQLPAYLNVLHQLPGAKALLGVEELVPAGVFYLNLRGTFTTGANRNDTLANAREARQAAYQHTGRFDLAALDRLDNRHAAQGDQFKYRLKKDGTPHAGSAEVLDDRGLRRLMDRVEHLLKEMGRRIYAGEVTIDPYKLKADAPCAQCDYRPICRIDPWQHAYRSLNQADA